MRRLKHTKLDVLSTPNELPIALTCITCILHITYTCHLPSYICMPPSILHMHATFHLTYTCHLLSYICMPPSILHIQTTIGKLLVPLTLALHIFSGLSLLLLQIQVRFFFLCRILVFLFPALHIFSGLSLVFLQIQIQVRCIYPSLLLLFLGTSWCASHPSAPHLL